MVPNYRTLQVLAARFGREGRKEFGHSLYFWEVTVDFTVFEEVIKHNQ